MAIHRFEDRLRDSHDRTIRQALDKFYASLWPAVIVLKVAALNDRPFQFSGRDVKAVLRAARDGPDIELTICETIEEKIRSVAESHYRDLLIETTSNLERGTAGWIYSSHAEWLAYVRQVFGQQLHVSMLPMSELRLWFTLNWQRFGEKSARTILSNGTCYTTLNRVVPLSDPDFAKFWHAHGCRTWLVPL